MIEERMQTSQRISYHSISRLYLADVGDVKDRFGIRSRLVFSFFISRIQRQIAADGEVAVM